MLQTVWGSGARKSTQSKSTAAARQASTFSRPSFPSFMVSRRTGPSMRDRALPLSHRLFSWTWEQRGHIESPGTIGDCGQTLSSPCIASSTRESRIAVVGRATSRYLRFEMSSRGDGTIDKQFDAAKLCLYNLPPNTLPSTKRKPQIRTPRCIDALRMINAPRPRSLAKSRQSPALHRTTAGKSMPNTQNAESKN